MNEEETGIRLNKYLASCGKGSRRSCDELIRNGKVIVNGSVCTNMSMRITEDDFVRIEGKRVLPNETTTIVLNKPRGLVCTKNDELDRDTIYKLLPPNLQHLNHVGRLDKDSEGLLILTNDGELAQKLSHPTKKVEKEYLVTVTSAFSNDVLDQFLDGLHTEGGRCKAKYIKRLSPRRFLITLETGMKRQIRLMCKAVHLQVNKLVRTRIGSLTGGGLEPGRFRTIEMDDIEMLMMNPKFKDMPNRGRSTARKGKFAAKKKAQRPRSTPKSAKSYKRRKK